MERFVKQDPRLVSNKAKPSPHCLRVAEVYFETMNPLPEPYASLSRRLGRDRLEQRLTKQANHWAHLAHQGNGIFRLEAVLPLDRMVQTALSLSGLAGRARREFLNPRVVERHWHLPRLPRAFEGFQLLQLADLHLDLDPAFVPALIGRLQGLKYDAVVNTGDFRNTTHEDSGPALQAMREVLAVMHGPHYGILGNHDFIEKVPELESAGLTMLLNETASLDRGGERLWLAGVDDPHFYQTHDLEKASDGIPPEACIVLLAHSPEIVKELPPDRFDLVLCGHTHGGQLCLPGGRWLHMPVHQLDKIFIKGAWRLGRTQGYTSTGTGACAVPARLNCPGEITVHVLHGSTND
jgi:predicted MPP superfamily phosphohydrolase